jgi:antitoxin HicB
MKSSEPIAANARVFTAVYEPGEAGGYVVTFPAIPDLATEGSTLAEARTMAVDCLTGYLETLQAEGLPLPEGEEHTEPVIREAVRVTLKTA